jgi:hypothetical protein
MKKLTLLPLLFFAALFSLSSCRDEVSNMENLEKMRDTLNKVYPNVPGLSVNVLEYDNLIVVVRSAQLYNTNGENKQKIATEITNIALAVFGTNNELDKGQVIFTKEERSTDMDPADGQKFPILFPKQ